MLTRVRSRWSIYWTKLDMIVVLCSSFIIACALFCPYAVQIMVYQDHSKNVNSTYMWWYVPQYLYLLNKTPVGPTVYDLSHIKFLLEWSEDRIRCQRTIYTQTSTALRHLDNQMGSWVWKYLINCHYHAQQCLTAIDWLPMIRGMDESWAITSV
jgi:hypothetical protein